LENKSRDTKDLMAEPDTMREFRTSSKQRISESMKRVIEASARNVEKWVEDHGYKACDPFDGLCSILRPLTFGNVLAERLLEQIIRQSPLNLRPLLGVKPHVSAKGIGYMAWGYLNMFKVTEDVCVCDMAFRI